MAASPSSPNGQRALDPLRATSAPPDATQDDSRALVSLWVAGGGAIVLLGSIGLLAAVSLPVGIAGVVMGRRALRGATAPTQVRYARAALWVGALTAVVSFAAAIAWITALAGGAKTAPSADDTSWHTPAVHVAAIGDRPLG